MSIIPDKELVIQAHKASLGNSIKAYEDFQEESMHPMETNEALLMQILKDNKDTEYGKKYGFEDIHSVKEYQERVPVIEYSDIDPLLERMLAGEKNILTAYPFSHMCETSGTVGKQKLVPLTDRQSAVFVKYNRYYTDGFVEKHLSPEWIEGRAFATAEGTHHTAPSGITCGSASSVMAKYVNGGKEALGQMMRVLYTSPVEASIPEPGTQTNYIHIRFALMDKDITGIISGFYLQTLQVFQYIADNYEMLINDIEKGTIDESIMMPDSTRESLLAKLEPMPKRAAELREIFKNGSDFQFVPKIWPKLMYLQGVGGDGFAVYSRNIKEHFTGDAVANIYSGITASEGLWSIPVELESEDCALVPGSAFMEFLPVEAGSDFSKCVTMDQVEVGKTYELIITNLCGYYRYRMSDAVQVTGYYNKTPRVRFMYRVNKTVNMVGEKTTEKAMQLSVEAAAEELGFDLVDYTMYPDQDRAKPRYEFLVQPRIESDREGISEEALSASIEKWLCHFNAEYGFGQAESSGRIAPSVSYWLQPESTFLYRDIQIMKGASPTQLKPVRVISKEEQKKFFYSLRDRS